MSRLKYRKKEVTKSWSVFDLHLLVRRWCKVSWLITEWRKQHPCHPALLLTLKRKMFQLPQLKIPVQLLVPPWLKPLFLQLHNTWKKSESLSKGKSQITSSFLAQTKSHGEQKLKQRSNKIKKLHKIIFVIQVPAMVTAHFLIWWTKGFSKKSTR